MMGKIQKLTLAVTLGVGFLVFRLLYAWLFAGLGIGQTLLFELPQVKLPGIFSHISLFGPTYLEPILANLRMALPFSLSIVLFGAISMFITPKWLLQLAQKSEKFHRLVMAIAIGLIQIPAMFQAVGRINRALRLRGESKFVALIPILETAVQRALSIAQRITLSKARDRESFLEFNKVTIPGTQASELSLRLNGGEVALISGPTGSGKSSVLRLAAGFGSELGQAALGEVTTFSSIGFVAQDPRDQLFGPLVKDELVHGQHSDFPLQLDLEVELLSEGEAVLLTLLRELSKKPQLLILDEPFAALDAISSARAIELLKDFTKAGGAILIAEHRFDHLESLNPKRYELVEAMPTEPKVVRTNRLVGSENSLDIHIPKLAVADRVLAEAIWLRVAQAETVAITGLNGAGKTTLLNELCSGKKPYQIAMVPERVVDFFVTLSLGEELMRADRVAKVATGFTLEIFRSIVTTIPDMAIHPRDLSAGNQLALAIAMQLSHKPKVLLIDEPVRGFDPELRERVAETLRCVQETGCAIIFTTHDHEFVADLADTVYQLADQKLERISGVMA